MDSLLVLMYSPRSHLRILGGLMLFLGGKAWPVVVFAFGLFTIDVPAVDAHPTTTNRDLAFGGVTFTMTVGGNGIPSSHEECRPTTYTFDFGAMFFLFADNTSNAGTGEDAFNGIINGIFTLPLYCDKLSSGYGQGSFSVGTLRGDDIGAGLRSVCVGSGMVAIRQDMSLQFWMNLGYEIRDNAVSGGACTGNVLATSAPYLPIRITTRLVPTSFEHGSTHVTSAVGNGSISSYDQYID